MHIGTTNRRCRFREQRRRVPSRMHHDADLYRLFDINFLMTELAVTDTRDISQPLRVSVYKHHVTQACKGYNIYKQDSSHPRQSWYCLE